MRTLFLIIWGLGIAVPTLAQRSRGADCGTVLPADYSVPSAQQRALMQQKATTPIVIRTVVTVFADDDGSNRAATDADIRRQFQQMVNQFAPHNICFLLQEIRQLNNTDLNDQVDSTEAGEVAPFRVLDALNIFIHDKLPGLNGTAYRVLNPAAYLSLSGATISDTDNVSTMAHEVGHVFGLAHTHETSRGVERVARSGSCSNCEDAGDGFCDTPADPNYDLDGGAPDYMAANTTPTCSYTGTRTDVCGATYTPNVQNIMAYGLRSCRNQFSAAQAATMRIWLTISTSLFANIIVDEFTLNLPIVIPPFITGTTRSSGTYVDSALEQITVGQNGYLIVNGTANQTFQAKRIVWKPGTQISPGTQGRTRATANPYCQ